MRYVPLSLSLSLGCLILSSTCLAQTTNWVQVKPANSPSARWQHGMAHDFVRGRTILFGGAGTVANMNDTWEYDGTNWMKMTPKTMPPGRGIASMAYHLARANTVMFGGRGASGNLNDTWIWDGKDWTKMNPKNSPSARYGHSMEYDSARGRTVLFGGRDSSVRFNDTWEWDGTDWTKITTKNSPPVRYFHNIAYDSARKVIVLFGGWSLTNDTWEYDGKDWTQITTKNAPTPRYCPMAYDVARKRTVIFGGWNQYYQETWEYDGSTWTQMKPATQPTGRYGFDLMVYDQRRSRMVLFGGRSRAGIMGDTWEYGASQSLTGTPATISIASGGAHTFSLDAGTVHANRLYWIFGSVTGTSPGVTLASPVGSVNIPLNPDFYTDITIALANTPLLTKTRGALDGAGKGSASLNVPKITNQAAIGVKLYHAFLVYDAQGNFYMASNPVELMLVK